MKGHFYLLAISLCAMLISSSTELSAQLRLKLKYNATDQTWGIYVKPDPSMQPSGQTITGTGQVTLVAPRGFILGQITNKGGTWVMNARVNSPSENPSRDYLSFGFLNDLPAIKIVPAEETLLFTIKKVGNCPDSLYLIDNRTDPFNQIPNSFNSNPGNALSIFDLVSRQLYEYTGNYHPCSWNCNVECDPDAVTSTENVLENERLVIAPNPTTGMTMIRTIDANIQSVTVRNLAGASILSEKLFSTTYQLDLTTLPNGLYIAQIKTDKGVRIEKIVLSR